MIDIKNTEGAVILSVSIASDGVITTELMKQDNITLSWISEVNDIIPLGSYIEYEGERYSLLEPYSPIQISEVEYEYKPVFHSRIMRWQHIPFFHYNKVDGEIVSKEPDWTLTDNPANFMSVICDAIKNETGEEWTYAIADNLPASVSLSFSNVDIFSALNSIANEFQTEWWVDKANRVLHLSKASFGEPVILEVGNNIKIPSVTNSKNGYFTRFYAFGSTRNIAQDYDGANVNNQTNRRLTLDPVKYPDGYKDIRDNLSDDEIISKVLFFDNVYPKSNLVISNVRVRLMWQLDNDNNKVQVGTDENGNPIYSQYAIWYFKIPGYVYNEKNIIPGKPISVHFNSGALSGREFELSYTGTQKEIKTNDGEPFIKDADDYEILFIEEGSYIIPAITGLIPNDGDEITLFNIVMPEQYKQSAYDELETELDKEIARLQSDLNNYSFESNPVNFFSNNPNLSIGRSVTYVNGEYSYNTRVIKLETNLDFAFEQKITIGNEQIKGNTQELKEEVVNANRDINLLASINEMTNSITQAYNRTQKALLDSMATYGDMLEIKTLSNGEKILYTRYGFASEKAISWRGVSTSGGGTSGGGLIQRVYGYDNITDVFDNSVKTDTFNAFTIAKIAERVSALENGGVDLTGYATESWVLNQNYLTSVSFSEILDTPTTLAGYGITDALSKSGGILDSGSDQVPLILNSTGATTRIAFTQGDTILGYFGFDAVNNPVFIYSTGGARAILHADNYSNYALPLSGGTIKGTADGYTQHIIKINTNDIYLSDIQIQMGDNPKAGVGYSATNAISGHRKGVFLYNVTASSSIGVKDDGTPYYNDNTLIHSGNIGSQSVDRAKHLMGSYTSNFDANECYTTLNSIKYHYGFSPESANIPESYTWSNGLLEIGLNSSGDTAQFFFSFNKPLSYRSRVTESWKTIAFTDSNVASADYATSAGNANTLGGVSFQNILERNYSGTARCESVGWKRIGKMNTYGNAILLLYRVWNNGEPEVYAFSISKSESSNWCDISQISGNYNIRTITKIRIDRDGYIDFYYNYTSWNNVRWTIIGGGVAYTTAEDNPTEGTTIVEFETVRGAKSYKGYTGNLEGNAASATKLATPRTIWGQSFDGTGDVSGDLKIGNSNILDGNNRRIVYSSGTDLYFGTSDVGIYNTYLSGNSVALRYGEGVPIGLLLNNKGNVLIGTTTDNGGKLQVSGSINAVKDGYAYYWGTNMQYSLGSNSNNDFYIFGDYGDFRIGTAGVERIRVKANGNVLIGTTEDNGNKLQIIGNINTSIGLICGTKNNYTAYFGAANPIIGNPNTGALIYSYGDNPIHFYTNNTARMQINGNGNILIGTTTDSGYKLDVNGKSHFSAYTGDNSYVHIGPLAFGLKIESRGNGNTFLQSQRFDTETAYYNIVLQELGGNVLIGTTEDNGNKLQVAGNISASGSISWGSASDRRLKDNINTIASDKAIDVIMALNPVTFEWNKTATEKDNSLKGVSCGFIADEYTKVIPNSSRPIWEEYTAIDYKLTAAFVVKGLQSHEERLRVLERENRELKNEFNKLRGYGN